MEADKNHYLLKIKTKKLMVTSEITPEAYKTLPQFTLDVTSQQTEIGRLLVAFHEGQLCFSSIVSKNNAQSTLDSMKALFPNAKITYFVSEVDSLLSKPVIHILLKGTDLERSVWKELLNIPFGETCSYSEIAERAGNIKAVRSVSTAVGHNPIWYIIPCHRVVRKNGDVGNYSASGGTDLKKYLLEFEKIHK